jgi:hypothetical protein
VSICMLQYRRHGLSRIVKGIPAEIQTSWLARLVKGIPAEIQTARFSRVG